MGVAHSKKTSESEQHAETSNAKRRESSSNGDSENESHRHHDDDVTPRRLQKPHYCQEVNTFLTPSHMIRATLLAKDHEEEEKLSEPISQADLKHNLSTMFNSMVIMDQSRRHTSRAAVHPVEEQRQQEPPSFTRPIESLPPPVHEMKRDERRGSSSLPVRCPRQNATISEDDSEYLSKLYDLRTWNMYRLINDSRRKRQIEYRPNIVEEKTPEYDDEQELPETDEPSSFTTNMIFAIDLE